MRTITRDDIREHLPPRPDNAHKGTMGSLCAVTGSYGYAGAAMLCARAALRSGVGLLYQMLPQSIYPAFTAYAPEAVCLPLDGVLSAAHADMILRRMNACNAAVIGCGIGNTDSTRPLIAQVVRECTSPLLLDADGLNALCADMDALCARTAGAVLTPHPKEFERMTGISVGTTDSKRADAAERFIDAYPNTVLVLKGDRTIVASCDGMLLNTAGNPGMAKGGSGDVLSGIIASLMAQGADAFDAAVMGVHIHALAGDIAAQHLSRTAMLPSDIIEHLPQVFLDSEE